MRKDGRAYAQGGRASSTAPRGAEAARRPSRVKAAGGARASREAAPAETRPVLRARRPGRLLRVVAISGSLRAGNLTRRSLEIALRGAAGEGAVTELLDLSALELPFCDERRDEASYPPDVARLRRAVGRAHGILLGSPEYHGSMSGALKNALDLLGFAQLEGKMVGLVAVAGGSQSATGTLSHMRTICRHLHAWVVPRQVSISRISDAFTSEGHLKDPAHEERLLEVGSDVARYAALHFRIPARRGR
jgi:NAD(P)H-dependent FMN reductase